MTKKNETENPLHLLKSLKEEGIEEIYLPSSESLSDSVKAPAAPSSKKEALLALRKKTLQCTKCDELALTRKSVVFGAGNVNAKLMFVGEAPGHDEDVQGLPFVGRAGKLLTKIIEAMGLSREEVYITNVVKCRPPNNRVPLPNESSVCKQLLIKELETIQPEVICTLGATATQAILGEEIRISQARGNFFKAGPFLVMPTYHPAYLLRNPSAKHEVWLDMIKICKHLGLSKKI